MGSSLVVFFAGLAMSVSIIPHPKPATAEDVARYETLIGTKLPPAYREFLLRSNGGKPDFSTDRNIWFPIRWNGQSWAKAVDGAFLESLDSLDAGARTSLFNSFEYTRGKQRLIPADTVTIGDATGGAVLLGVGAGNAGQVFYWAADYMSPEDDRVPDYSNVGFIADDFSEFLALLKPYKQVRAGQGAK